jgi:hypothetical protein
MKQSEQKVTNKMNKATNKPNAAWKIIKESKLKDNVFYEFMTSMNSCSMTLTSARGVANKKTDIFQGLFVFIFLSNM